MRSRPPGNGMQYDDRRNGQSGEDVHNLLAVGSAVDAELVLDDGHIAAVEQSGAGGHRGLGAVDEFADDAIAGTRQPVSHPHHVDRGAVGGQSICQRRGEIRQSAWGGRVGAEQADGRSAATGTLQYRGAREVEGGCADNSGQG